MKNANKKLRKNKGMNMINEIKSKEGEKERN